MRVPTLAQQQAQAMAQPPGEGGGPPAPNTGASPVGPGQSAPGGTPNNPNGEVAQNAQAGIKNADKQGESLARSQLPHE